MNYRTFMTVYAVVSLLFGLGFIFAPGLLLSIYGVETDASFRYIGQLFGAALITLAVLSWLFRTAGNRETQKMVTLSLLVGEGIGFVVALFNQFAGAMNAFGWSVVAVYLLLTAGLAYFYFGKPVAQIRSTART